MDDLLALLPLITVFFIFYVILYIPQRRRQKKHKIYID
jgi:preprotein translocase subunit YajC